MTVTLERRVSQLEQELAKIKNQLADIELSSSKDLRRTFGVFKDDPEFDAIIEAGAADRRRQPKC